MPMLKTTRIKHYHVMCIIGLILILSGGVLFYVNTVFPKVDSPSGVIMLITGETDILINEQLVSDIVNIKDVDTSITLFSYDDENLNGMHFHFRVYIAETSLSKQEFISNHHYSMACTDNK